MRGAGIFFSKSTGCWGKRRISMEFQKFNSIAFKSKKKCIRIVLNTKLKKDTYKYLLKKKNK